MRWKTGWLVATLQSESGAVFSGRVEFEFAPMKKHQVSANGIDEDETVRKSYIRVLPLG